MPLKRPTFDLRVAKISHFPVHLFLYLSWGWILLQLLPAMSSPFQPHATKRYKKSSAHSRCTEENLDVQKWHWQISTLAAFWTFRRRVCRCVISNVFISWHLLALQTPWGIPSPDYDFIPRDGHVPAGGKRIIGGVKRTPKVMSNARL